MLMLTAEEVGPDWFHDNKQNFPEYVPHNLTWIVIGEFDGKYNCNTLLKKERRMYLELYKQQNATPPVTTID